MKERRRHQRRTVRRRVWCEGDAYSMLLPTFDASEDGVGIRTSIPPPPGTRLRISLDEPEGRVVAEAEVVWSRALRGRQGGMGLRILSFAEGYALWCQLFSEESGPEGSSQGADDEDESRR